MQNKFIRWLVRGLVGLVGLLVLLVGLFYGLSENLLNKHFEPVARTVAIPDDAESIAEGERLARVRGCMDGCHGEGARGQMFFILVAPNLTRLSHDYSTTELEAAVRQGIRPDGRSVFAMPSSSFSHMSDTDFGKIVAFLRSLPISDNDPGTRHFPAEARGLLLYATYWEGLNFREAEVTSKVTPPAEAPTEPVAFGRYLAKSICAECHGLDLTGQLEFPDLIVASAYSREEFHHLLATGEPTGDRELGLMGEMARHRFVHMNADEVDALYSYLTSDEFLTLPRE